MLLYSFFPFFVSFVFNLRAALSEVGLKVDQYGTILHRDTYGADQDHPDIPRRTSCRIFPQKDCQGLFNMDPTRPSRGFENSQRI